MNDKRRNKPYWKILVRSDGSLKPVCVQWFDEWDYGGRLLDIAFDSEEEAWKAIKALKIVAWFEILGWLEVLMRLCRP